MNKKTADIIKIIGLVSLCVLGIELGILEMGLKEALSNVGVCLAVLAAAAVYFRFHFMITGLHYSLMHKLSNGIKPEWYEVCATLTAVLITACVIILFIQDGEPGKAVLVAIAAFLILFVCGRTDKNGNRLTN